MNINGHHDRFGAWEDRRKMLLELMRFNKPDIIALQAVSRMANGTAPVDQASELANLLPGGFSTVFAPTQTGSQGNKEGLALLSHVYLADTQASPLTLLPDLDDSNRRLVLYTRFDLASTTLHLFNGNFSWVAEQAELNVKEALSFLNQFAGPRLLVGDLNTPHDSPVFDPLRSAGWEDAWMAKHPDQPGYTFEAGNWWTRIDYAWLDPELAHHLVDVQVVGDETRPDGVHPSNHAGLLIELDLEK
jgi:endonuclease/exonuclease/phosphatase family metal-dependent hydrolase